MTFTVETASSENDIKEGMALFLLAAVSLVPFLGSAPGWIPPFESPLAQWLVKALVVSGLFGLTFVAVGSQWQQLGLLWLLAPLLAAWHWHWIDRYAILEEWQRRVYLDTVPTTQEGLGLSIPHCYRPLPFGFVRALELLTGDWTFSCVAYRTFFTWWFLWAWARFAGQFLSPKRAILSVLPILIYYPASTLHYYGQLTDPLSHFLFALALCYLVQDRYWLLLLATALGILAKETAVLIVPAYFFCNWRNGSAWLKAALLGLTCIGVFAAARLPWGWRPGASLTDVQGLMLGANLGIGKQAAWSTVPLWARYLHWTGFTIPFLLVITYSRWRMAPRLRILVLVLTPLILGCNLCFGWAYESRNYVPLLPVLSTAALAGISSGRNSH